MSRANRVLAVQIVLSGLAIALLLGAATRAVRSPSSEDLDDEPEVANIQTPVGANYTSHDVQHHEAKGKQRVVGISSPNQRDVDQPGRYGERSGTIVKSGTELLLRSHSGTCYRLDSDEKAKAFEGRSVTVAGDVVEAMRFIHVSEIRAVIS